MLTGLQFDDSFIQGASTVNTDICGYYAALGLPSSASAAEIKAAYRRLAKLHHPDSGSSQGDAEIKRINEAYAVLVDPSRRAAYDGESIESEHLEATQRNSIEPLRCSRCNKITAQPRYLLFWRVYSLIFATIRSPVQGVFCAACAKAEALRSTTITGFFGWWGVPWGPVWTVGCGIQDALGGKQEKSRNEALAWHNVVAFIQARQIPIAYGLADRLTNAEDKQIRTAAGDFTAMCRSHGFQPDGELKDSWSGLQRQAPLRFAILAVLPALLAAWIYLEIAPSGNSESYELADSYDYSTPAFDNSAEGVPAPLEVSEIESAPPCANTPENGEILAGSENLSQEGHQLDIDNGSSGDAIVKLRSMPANQLYASFFVHRGEEASLSGIEDGTYSVQYAVGETLAEDCATFTPDASIAEFPGSEAFEAQYVNDYRGEGFIYQRLSYTLYSVVGGNIRPTSISASDFNSD